MRTNEEIEQVVRDIIIPMGKITLGILKDEFPELYRYVVMCHYGGQVHTMSSLGTNINGTPSTLDDFERDIDSKIMSNLVKAENSIRDNDSDEVVKLFIGIFEEVEKLKEQEILF